jgi:hypothetical protein
MQAPSGKKSHPKSLSVNERSSFSCIRIKQRFNKSDLKDHTCSMGSFGSTFFLLQECNISSSTFSWSKCQIGMPGLKLGKAL